MDPNDLSCVCITIHIYIYLKGELMRGEFLSFMRRLFVRFCVRAPTKLVTTPSRGRLVGVCSNKYDDNQESVCKYRENEKPSVTFSLKESTGPPPRCVLKRQTVCDPIWSD